MKKGKGTFRKTNNELEGIILGVKIRKRFKGARNDFQKGILILTCSGNYNIMYTYIIRRKL